MSKNFWQSKADFIIGKTHARLLHCSPTWLVALAVRTCSDTVEKMDTVVGASSGMNYFNFGPKDKSLITEKCLKVGQDFKKFDQPHTSVLEHMVYTFNLFFSRALLQELARHRIGVSPSVQSTRYALKKILKNADYKNREQLGGYIYKTGDAEIDEMSAFFVGILVEMKKKRKPNDKAKYLVPESFMSRAVLTINARSLRHLLCLRTSKRALKEFRELSFSIASQIPFGHRFLIVDCLNFDSAPENFLMRWPDEKSFLENHSPPSFGGWGFLEEQGKKD